MVFYVVCLFNALFSCATDIFAFLFSYYMPYGSIQRYIFSLSLLSCLDYRYYYLLHFSISLSIANKD